MVGSCGRRTEGVFRRGGVGGAQERLGVFWGLFDTILMAVNGS